MPPQTPGRRIAALIAANTSFLVAVLVYMGWAYETAYLGYFHIKPLDLGAGVVEYLLYSLDLFRQDLVLAAVVVLAIAAGRTADIWPAALTRTARQRLGAATAWASRVPALRPLAARLPGSAPRATPFGVPRQYARQRLAARAGAAVTAVALLLLLIARYTPVSTYLVLLLLGTGPLLLTWPNRNKRHGRFPRALAIVIATVCGLWATSVYAESTGTSHAQGLVRDLQSKTAVVLYSTQRLALTGPGVISQPLPPGALYHYAYQGLRLLIMRSGTYYLLPVGWSRQQDLTYVIPASDRIMVVLISG